MIATVKRKTYVLPLSWYWSLIDSLDHMVCGKLTFMEARSVVVTRLGRHALAEGIWKFRPHGDCLEIVDKYGSNAKVLERVYLPCASTFPSPPGTIRHQLNIPRGALLKVHVTDLGQRPCDDEDWTKP